MTIYAHVIEGKVVNLVEFDGAPFEPEQGEFVLADGSAVIGGDYADGQFSGGPAPAVKTKMTKYAFRQRLTFQERCLLKSSNDIGVQVLIEDLMSAEEVNLADQGFQLGMLYLHSVYPDVFTEERINQLSATEA